jgi:hypothetical protein
MANGRTQQQQQQQKMDYNQREGINVLRLSGYRFPTNSRTNFSWPFPFGILARGISFMWREYCTMGGPQEVTKEVIKVRTPAALKQVMAPIEIHITCRSRLRKWAFDNAYTLMFLSAMFVVTWSVIVLVHYVI